MFADGRRALVLVRICQLDLRQFARFLAPDRFADAATLAGIKIRDNPSNPTRLAWPGIAAARHQGESFAGVLPLTLLPLRDCESPGQGQLPAPSPRRRPGRSKHDPRGHDPAAVTEEAFVNARKGLPSGFRTALIVTLADAFHHRHPDALRFRGSASRRRTAPASTCRDPGPWPATSAPPGAAAPGGPPRPAW